MMFTDTAILLGMGYVYLPLMVLPLYVNIKKFDLRLAEAASDLCAKLRRVLMRIIVPMVAPGLIAGSILVFVPSLGANVTPRLPGGAPT